MLYKRRFESAPGLRSENRQQHQQDGPQRFRELPGFPVQGDVLILRRTSLPELPAPAQRASPSPHQVAKHGCHNRAPLASTIDVQDGWHGGKRVMDTLPTKWAAGCRYSELSTNKSDPACVGCAWKAKE